MKGEIFFVKGRIIKSKGWKAVYEGQKDKDDQADEEHDQSLPEIKKSGKPETGFCFNLNGKTKPPARYNEARLLTAMEHPGKFIENDALREAMDKTSGLGTPATRADIIEKLFSSFY